MPKKINQNLNVDNVQLDNLLNQKMLLYIVERGR